MKEKGFYSIQEPIALLQLALEIEHSYDVYYPQLEKQVAGSVIYNTLIKLREDSLRHAEIATKIVVKLGGTPNAFNAPPLQKSWDIETLFHTMLEYERLSNFYYTRVADLVSPEMALIFRDLAGQEAEHATCIQEILGMLKQNSVQR